MGERERKKISFVIRGQKRQITAWRDKKIMRNFLSLPRENEDNFDDGISFFSSLALGRFVPLLVLELSFRRKTCSGANLSRCGGGFRLRHQVVNYSLVDFWVLSCSVFSGINVQVYDWKLRTKFFQASVQRCEVTLANNTDKLPESNSHHLLLSSLNYSFV